MMYGVCPSVRLSIACLDLKPRSDWQVSGASFLAPENLCKKTCASFTFTLRKFSVQESGYKLLKNPISSRSSNQRRSFTTETCLK